MRTVRCGWNRACGLLLFVAASGMCAAAQAGSASSVSVADEAKIRTYISHGWDTLSRSMSECKSVKDLKVTTAPVLYLPAGMAVPASVAAMQHECGVKVMTLPRVIHQLGDVKTSELPVEGLLYLPNKYVVPGGRFNEMYGWDSYFILLGLVHDGRNDLARGMVENFFFEIENYGAILNANRTYFFTRSQPPFLSSMIREVYDDPNSKLDKVWLARAYAAATQDYSLWTSPIHQAGTTGLARYRDLGEGPVPEMADDSSYYPDVIRWLLKHPGEHPEYLVDGANKPTPAEIEGLKTTSCDVTASKVCASAVVDGHRLSKAFFEGDRAMRESGFDTSFRFGSFSGSTEDYAPVCLNSLLYKYEMDMAQIATTLGKDGDARRWAMRGAARHKAINRYLWDADASMYLDYDFVHGKPSSYHYVTAFYPLWAGLASKSQAAGMLTHLSLFEKSGGMAMSDNESGVQWDLPFGWAPTNWLAVAGLEKAGYHNDAVRIAHEFSKTVLDNFLLDGTMREKYNVVSGDANVKVAAGYKSNVVGFGWTNGVYLMLGDILRLAK